MVEFLVFTSEMMAHFDRKAEESYNVPSLLLMENAGSSVADYILSLDEEIYTAVVVAGTGNNGGDGFVVARHLHQNEVSTTVIVVGNPEKIKGDARTNFEIVKTIPGINLFKAENYNEWAELLPFIEGADVVIDALFGTGLKRPLEGFYADVVNDINFAAKKIISVDIPSGLSANTWEEIGPAIYADATVTFEAFKIAHLFPPAEDHVGELVLARIGIPPEAYEEDEYLPYRFVYPDGLFPRKLFMRESGSHKGDYGHVLIIAGSKGKTGAAVMAGAAALKSGAGLVTVATPESVLPTVASFMPELMTYPLKDRDGFISEKAIDQLAEVLEGKTVVAVGPGIGTEEETERFLKALIEKVRVPLVLDADAINLLAREEKLPSFSSFTVITPHPGEFSRLIRKPKQEIMADRLNIALNFSLQHNLVLVLKGYRTLVATPDGVVYINGTGNPGMATGGSGDILTGMIAGFLAQAEDHELEESVIEAVGFHGLAGDLASLDLTQPYLTATDLLDYLPEAFKYDFDWDFSI